MRKAFLPLVSCFLLLPGLVSGMGEDDPVITTFMVDQLETRETHGEDTVAWDVGFSVGKDLNEFQFKNEGEKHGGVTETSQIRAIYSRAIAPYWNINAGVRHDVRPDPERNWLEVGFSGLAPYFVETELSLFVGRSGRSGLRAEFEKEYMITRKWVMVPEIELEFYGHNDEDTEVGSGLSHTEVGIRFQYEVKREFAPYVGINWEKSWGKTADYHREEGDEISDTQVVLGIRAWF
jgi:copper resistance protein B